jgi:subtilisin family serine protease
MGLTSLLKSAGRFPFGERSGALLVLLLFASAAHASAPYREGRILVQPKPGVRAEALNALHSASHSQLLRAFDRFGRLQVVTVPPGQTVEAAVARYERSSLVAFAEPDYLIQTAGTVPNDPKYQDGTLWGLDVIHAPQGWDVQSSASNVVVAVLDTGVRYTHQDLAANMWVNPQDGSHGTNSLAGNTDPSDDSGHGTMVAGVLGAVGNNGIGVVGVAWHVQIMACKCFNSLGAGTVADCVAGLDYAQANKARVINASWGFSADSLALSNAFWSLRTDGIIVVAAAGNAGVNVDLSPSYPAGYHLDNVVTVAYTSRADALAAASNYGASSVHLAAPGESIYSTFAATDNYYLAETGTSFAAPYVTGTLALLRAKYPGDSYLQSITRVLNGTDPLASLAGKCASGGRLNIANALAGSIQLRAVGMGADGSFRLRVLSAPNQPFILRAAANLTSWFAVITNSTSDAGTYDFSDAPNSGPARRYYRASAAP